MSTILIDVDDTIYDLVTKWLMIFNREHQGNVKKQEIKNWMISKYVKPELAIELFRILERNDLYDDIKILPNAKRVIENIRRKNHKVIFVTAGNHPNKESKLLQDKIMLNREEYIIARDKNLIKGDVLIDDGYHNIKSFDGLGILLSQPWNNKFHRWKYKADNWLEIEHILKDNGYL